MAGMTAGRRCELTVHGHLARSVIVAVRERFDVGSVQVADSTVLTLDAVDQAAIRALMIMLWDSGHEVLAMSTADAPTSRAES